jgi:hypothetical protein
MTAVLPLFNANSVRKIYRKIRRQISALHPGSHTLPAWKGFTKITGVIAEKTCTNYLNVPARRIATRPRTGGKIMRLATPYANCHPDRSRFSGEGKDLSRHKPGA